ncbi:MAG: MBL fold metallo-hydrolase [Archaeoglobaceae archaeon]|nr:MBL fold metallo-hydrolase [Archaeoglobaceae archaeon]MDW8117927.1 MBL fold metallo-hydrolase [Archaeoglobaceae archaeon]
MDLKKMNLKIADDFYLLKPGKVVFDDSGAILYASSSVSLILDEPRIVVDTGLPIDEETITQALTELGLKPSEIEIVINTHLHPDHCGGNELFKAKIYVHPLEILRTGAKYLPFPSKISERVKIIETPGHIDGHISVVFDRSIVVAGDAIPTKDNYLKRVIPRFHTDAKKARESMEKIIEIAKIIIPGHDGPIYLK